MQAARHGGNTCGCCMECPEQPAAVRFQPGASPSLERSGAHPFRPCGPAEAAAHGDACSRRLPRFCRHQRAWPGKDFVLPPSMAYLHTGFESGPPCSRRLVCGPSATTGRSRTVRRSSFSLTLGTPTTCTTSTRLRHWLLPSTRLRSSFPPPLSLQCVLARAAPYRSTPAPRLHGDA